jgi:cytoskeletal protein CcmA (bactofilin family)
MQNNIAPTGLIRTPDSEDLYFIKSENIKVFPSSWRGSEILFNGDTLSAGFNLPFNPESAMNTEYNITRTAGAVKTYIDQLTTNKVLIEAADGKVTNIDCYSFKFFINGYAFEIHNLKTEGLTSDTSNLFAYIRIGDMAIGENPIDNTKVLMPFTWTSVDTPVSLDATKEKIYNLANIPTSSMSETDKADKDTYLFTGLALSNKPLTDYLDGLGTDNDGSYYSIQLLKNGKLCYENCWTTEITAGQETEGKSTLIGEKGLKADVEHMLAVGRFNETTVPATSTSEKTLFVVGNGTDETHRRNVFEVTGSTSPDFIIKNDSQLPVYSQTVKVSEVLKISYNSSAEKDDKGVAITGVDTINTGIELHPNGNSIVINKKKQATATAGALVYGDIVIQNVAEKDFSLSFKNADNNIIGGIQPANDDKLDIDGLNAINKGFVFTNNNNNAYTLSIGQNDDSAKIILGGENKFNVSQDGILNNVTKINQITVGNATLENLSKVASTDVAAVRINTNELNSNSLTVSGQTTSSKLDVSGKLTVGGEADFSNKLKLTSSQATISTPLQVNNNIVASKSLTVTENISTSNITAAGQVQAKSAILNELEVTSTNNFSLSSSNSTATIATLNKSTLDTSTINTDTINTTSISAYNLDNIKQITASPVIDELVIDGNVKITGNCNITSSFNCSPESLFTETLRKLMLKAMYPVGSIYIFADTGAANKGKTPYDIFGIGTEEWTWEKLPAGHTIVSTGNYNGRAFNLGGTGGSANLIVPSHKHTIDGTVDPNITRTSDIEYKNPAESLGDAISYKSVPHTHSVTVNEANSEHKHNIPVSFPIGLTDRALYDPANIGHNNATAYYQGNIRQNWWERLYMTDASGKVTSTNFKASNLVKERAIKLIPTVQLGSWYSPNGVDNTVNWNTHGPVYTGYQKMPEFSRKADWDTSFEDNWATFFNYKVGGNNILAYVCYDAGDIDHGDVLNNDYFGMSDGYYTSKLNSFDIDEKNICDDDNRISKLSNMHAAYLEDIRKALSAAGITSPTSSQVYKLFSQQLTSILNAVTAKYLIAGTAWNNNLVYPPAIRKKYLKHALNKLYVIKEAFFNDYLKSKTRANDSAADGDNLLDFTCRQDDGAHVHTATSGSTSISHNHALDLTKLKQYLEHTHPVADFPKETENNLANDNSMISGTNANYPPYFVCQIWRRIG